MSERVRVGDLEISQNLPFQRREWLVQRIGWVVIAVLLVAAMLGFFGPGPLSKTTASGGAGALSIEYYRFWRMASPMPLRIRIQPIANGQEEISMWISREYLEAMRVESVTPEPERVEAATDHFVYVFKLKDASSAATVMFDLEPARMGKVSGEIKVNHSAATNIGHFIYP